MRYTRSAMLDVLGQDYVRTARAKGLFEAVVVQRHALRNALLPVVTIIGTYLPALLGGAVFIESIFSWPGMGRLYLDGVESRDYPLIMGLTLVLAIAILVANLLTDLAYALIDPRIRYA
jgi:peptide/nickel transport system permease protein